MPLNRVNGIQIYYELHGEDNAPVLVLNNGILMNAANSWVFQTQALAQNYCVLQYDCRGQGQSEHPEEAYSMAQHADDLAALLAELRITQAHIAGISYGGEVAQAFALAYPQQVASLILADTVSEVGAELRHTIMGWLQVARLADPELFFNITVPWNFSPEFIAANPALLEGARARYSQLDFPAVARLCECFLAIDFTIRLGEVKAPTCILVGEKDILKGQDYAKIILRAMPHAEYHVLPGAGHASCWERPAEWNSIVLGFLAKSA